MENSSVKSKESAVERQDVTENLTGLYILNDKLREVYREALEEVYPEEMRIEVVGKIYLTQTIPKAEPKLGCSDFLLCPTDFSTVSNLG